MDNYPNLQLKWGRSKHLHIFNLISFYWCGYLRNRKEEYWQGFNRKRILKVGKFSIWTIDPTR